MSDSTTFRAKAHHSLSELSEFFDQNMRFSQLEEKVMQAPPPERSSSARSSSHSGTVSGVGSMVAVERAPLVPVPAEHSGPSQKRRGGEFWSRHGDTVFNVVIMVMIGLMFLGLGILLLPLLVMFFLFRPTPPNPAIGGPSAMVTREAKEVMAAAGDDAGAVAYLVEQGSAQELADSAIELAGVINEDARRIEGLLKRRSTPREAVLGPYQRRAHEDLLEEMRDAAAALTEVRALAEETHTQNRRSNVVADVRERLSIIREVYDSMAPAAAPVSDPSDQRVADRTEGPDMLKH